MKQNGIEKYTSSKIVKIKQKKLTKELESMKNSVCKKQQYQSEILIQNHMFFEYCYILLLLLWLLLLVFIVSEFLLVKI